MTPQEKAKDLVNKFNGGMQAIKCIDEIIEAISTFGYTHNSYDDPETGKHLPWTDQPAYIYWEKVKQEILNL